MIGIIRLEDLIIDRLNAAKFSRKMKVTSKRNRFLPAHESAGSTTMPPTPKNGPGDDEVGKESAWDGV